MIDDSRGASTGKTFPGPGAASDVVVETGRIPVVIDRTGGWGEDCGMKSAYELAMERLNKSEPAKVLTGAQKAELAEVESLYKARVAEQELRFREQIDAAVAAGDEEKAGELRSVLAQEKRRLEEDREAKKGRIRG